jgi:hypothetical protein
MKRITKIRLKNYRAFYGDSFALETGGKNVLLYGENGSGKSSLYRGMQDFFRASLDSDDITKNNYRHLHVDEYSNDIGTLSDISVIIEFDEPQEVLKLSNTANEVEGTFVAQTYLLNSFLSYKELLRTHHLSDTEGFTEKFSKLVLETILNNYQNPFTQNEFSDDSANIWININQIRHPPNPLTEAQIALMRSAVEKDFIQPYIDGLEEVLSQINEKLSSLLQSFGHNLVAKLVLVGHTNDFEPQVRLKINYLGIDNFNFLERGGEEVFYDHLDLLNEARLSALAVSIYLSAILSYPTEGMAYKILFLDDVLVGLDNTNRLPLLNILNTEFADYQVFITTYDRYWFEIAKEHLDEKRWTTAELYVKQIKDDTGRTIREEPILKPTQNNVERARFYADTFQDYPAAGNYLRKECERSLKKNLPPQYRIATDGSEINTLEALINQLEKYYEDCQIDISKEAIGRSLKVAKKAILNPTSHDDLRSPLYRGELEKVFDLVEKLQNLPILKKQNIAHKGDWITMKLVEHHYFICCELLSELVLVRCGNDVKFLPATVDVKGYKELENQIDWTIPETPIGNKTLKQIVEMVHHHLQIPLVEPVDEFLFFRLTNGENLENLKSKI